MKSVFPPTSAPTQFPVTLSLPNVEEENPFILLHTPQPSPGADNPHTNAFLFSAASTVDLPNSLIREYGACSPLAVGTTFFHDGAPFFRITGRGLLGSEDVSIPASCWAKARALVNIPAGSYALSAEKQGYSLAVITLSDKGSQGQRYDTSGPALAFRIAETLPISHAQRFLLPDSMPGLRTLVADLALHQGYDIVITTGGTGVSAQDVTPEAVAPLLERPLPGFTQAMMTASLHATPNAIVSRQVAGTIGQSIVLTVPGSKKAALENIEAILPALAHALDKLQGNTSDCAG